MLLSLFQASCMPRRKNCPHKEKGLRKMKLYKINPSGDGLIPAPEMVISNGQKVPVSEEFLRRLGYCDLLEVPPPAVPDGGTLVTKYEYVLEDVLVDPPKHVPEQLRAKYPKRYVKRPVSIKPVYEVVEPPPPPPRVFSKLKAVIALKEANLWDYVKAYIEESGLYDLYLAANEFREDDPYFKQGLSVIKEKLSISDEGVEELLKKCEV